MSKKTQTAAIINVTTPVAIINLSMARGDVVNVAGKTGEVLRAYAGGMCQAFNLRDNEGKLITPWYELKGKLKAGVKEEYKLFVDAMTAAGHEKNIHVYWQRVKEFSGYQTAGQRAKADESLEAKTLADLKTIINRIFKAEEEGEESQASEVKGLLMTAFETLGGDVMKLG
jgi:hypothetical protein